MSDSPTKRAVLELRKQEGNDVCADCGKPGKCSTYLGLVSLVPADVCHLVYHNGVPKTI